MRTTLNIDELLADAQRITGLAEKTSVVREGLRALIERESARHYWVEVIHNCKLSLAASRIPHDPGRHFDLD